MSFSYLLTRRRHLQLVLILIVLHGVLLLGPDNGSAQALFIIEVGLTLMWQPILRAEMRISALGAVVLALLISLVTLFFGWATLALWVMLLAGVVGGKIFVYDHPATRFIYLGALGYLVTALMMLVLPGIFPDPNFPFEIVSIGSLWLAPALLLMMLGFALRADQHRESLAEKVRDSGEVIDFIYSAFVFLLLAGLFLGALAFMSLTHIGLLPAMMSVLMLFGLSFLALGWAWNPHARFVGIGNLFSRQVMSLGLPLERWLHDLAIGVKSSTPDEAGVQALMASAGQSLINNLAWIQGGDWRDDSSHAHGAFGAAAAKLNRSEFRYDNLVIGLYTERTPPPTLLWHLDLLGRVLAQFYDDKQRSVELRRLTYVEAVHNTGARLTHDMRNLLQSLEVLCAVAEDENTEPAGLVVLARRQLPALRQRLAVTLEKLRVPREETSPTRRAADWFDSHYQYAALGVICRLEPAAVEMAVPVNLFDSAAENLIYNALNKTSAEGNKPTVMMTLDVCAGKPCLAVEDNGAAIAPELAARLFGGPLPSENGLGIGLYQLARQAQLNGFCLRLACNQPGCVRFALLTANCPPNVAPGAANT